MDCSAANRLFALFRAGALSHEDEAGFRDHLSGCGACRAKLAREDVSAVHPVPRARPKKILVISVSIFILMLIPVILLVLKNIRKNPDAGIVAEATGNQETWFFESAGIGGSGAGLPFVSGVSGLQAYTGRTSIAACRDSNGETLLRVDAFPDRSPEAVVMDRDKRPDRRALNMREKNKK